MAIGADALIGFFGTQDEVTTSASAVTDGSVSVAADTSEWTNDDDAEDAYFVLKVTFASAPTLNASVTLLARRINVLSTDDENEPTADHFETSLGPFTVNDGITAQVMGLIAELPNSKSSQEYVFYVVNNSGQTMNASWELHVTPKTLGPHA